jgi:hypothetical protein
MRRRACVRCGRMLRQRKNTTGLCYECFKGRNPTPYRPATPEERRLIDNARRSLVAALMRGDELTWSLTCQALAEILQEMRTKPPGDAVT